VKKITVDRIEKLIGRKHTEFSQIIFAVQHKKEEYPYGYSYAYVFVEEGDYFYQLQSSPDADDGRHIKDKRQLNQRIEYTYEHGWIFESAEIDNDLHYNTLLIKFTKEEFK